MSRGEIYERRRRVVLATLGLVLVVAATALPASLPDAAPHITLEASIPEDEEAVDGEVTEVRLLLDRKSVV